MEYTTYWSILDSPAYTIKSGIYFLILAILASLCFLLVKKYKKADLGGERFTILLGTGITALFGLVFLFLRTFIYPDKYSSEMAKKLTSDEFLKVEGEISNFNRRIERRRRGPSVIIESFTVDSVQFAYGNGLMGGAFSKINNDFIYNGQSVRITYLNSSPYGKDLNSILLFEVKK